MTPENECQIISELIRISDSLEAIKQSLKKMNDDGIYTITKEKKGWD
jgi:hypothetical protein